MTLGKLFRITNIHHGDCPGLFIHNLLQILGADLRGFNLFLIAPALVKGVPHLLPHRHAFAVDPDIGIPELLGLRGRLFAFAALDAIAVENYPGVLISWQKPKKFIHCFLRDVDGPGNMRLLVFFRVPGVNQ